MKGLNEITTYNIGGRNIEWYNNIHSDDNPVLNIEEIFKAGYDFGVIYTTCKKIDRDKAFEDFKKTIQQKK